MWEIVLKHVVFLVHYCLNPAVSCVHLGPPKITSFGNRVLENEFKALKMRFGGLSGFRVFLASCD